MAVVMYYLVRVKRWSSADMKESFKKLIPGKKSKSGN
jgi:hypothetical protein